MTKEQLVDALEKAVGDSAYGQSLVEEAAATFDDSDKKYGWTMKDRLDDKIGILKAYERIHKDTGKEAAATAEADKIAICEKALEAIEAL